MAIFEVLVAIEVVLQAFVAYQTLVARKKKVKAEDRLAYISTLRPLLDMLEFNKNVEARFEDFNESYLYWLKQLYPREIGKSVDLAELRDLWKPVERAYDKHIALQINELLGAKAKEADEIKQFKGDIPSRINDACINSRITYQKLVNCLRDSQVNFNNLSNQVPRVKIKEDIGPTGVLVSNFNSDRAQIQSQANMMIRYLVCIIAFGLEEFLRGEAK